MFSSWFVQVLLSHLLWRRQNGLSEDEKTVPVMLDGEQGEDDHLYYKIETGYQRGKMKGSLLFLAFISLTHPLPLFLSSSPLNLTLYISLSLSLISKLPINILPAPPIPYFCQLFHNAPPPLSLSLLIIYIIFMPNSHYPDPEACFLDQNPKFKMAAASRPLISRLADDIRQKEKHGLVSLATLSRHFESLKWPDV